MNSVQAAVLPSNRITFLQSNSLVAATSEVTHEEFPTLSAPFITLFSYSIDLGEFHGNHMKTLKFEELLFKIHILGCSAFCLEEEEGARDLSRIFSSF